MPDDEKKKEILARHEEAAAAASSELSEEQEEREGMGEQSRFPETAQKRPRKKDSHRGGKRRQGGAEKGARSGEMQLEETKRVRKESEVGRGGAFFSDGAWWK